MLRIDGICFWENAWVYSFRNFILSEILGHNGERIKLHLLHFTVVSLDSKTKGYSSVIFLSFILQFFTVTGDMAIGNSMLHK